MIKDDEIERIEVSLTVYPKDTEKNKLGITRRILTLSSRNEDAHTQATRHFTEIAKEIWEYEQGFGNKTL